MHPNIKEIDQKSLHFFFFNLIAFEYQRYKTKCTQNYILKIDFSIIDLKNIYKNSNGY